MLVHQLVLCALLPMATTALHRLPASYTHIHADAPIRTAIAPHLYTPPPAALNTPHVHHTPTPTHCARTYAWLQGHGHTTPRQVVQSGRGSIDRAQVQGGVRGSRGHAKADDVATHLPRTWPTCALCPLLGRTLHQQAAQLTNTPPTGVPRCCRALDGPPRPHNHKGLCHLTIQHTKLSRDPTAPPSLSPSLASGCTNRRPVPKSPGLPRQPRTPCFGPMPLPLTAGQQEMCIRQSQQATPGCAPGSHNRHHQVAAVAKQPSLQQQLQEPPALPRGCAQQQRGSSKP